MEPDLEEIDRRRRHVYAMHAGDVEAPTDLPSRDYLAYLDRQRARASTEIAWATWLYEEWERLFLMCNAAMAHGLRA